MADPALANETAAPTAPENRRSATLAFSLVVVMLAALFVLITVLVIVTAAYRGEKELVEYSKWSVSVLLTAFGAWIGAGAAYFFGKENLAESSRSTEQALRIQQAALRTDRRRERVKDLALTAMNSDFMFSAAAKKQEVLAKLDSHPDYWWVPVLDATGAGVLQDVLHTRVLWSAASANEDQLSKILSDLDASNAAKELKALHGSAFFVRVSLDDQLAQVADGMKKAGASVGIVVDDKGKPAYCFTRQEVQVATR